MDFTLYPYRILSLNQNHMLQELLSPYEFDVIAQRNSTKSRLGTMKSGEPWLSQERDRDNFFFFC